MVIAAVTGIVSPLSLLTSFYGMNVKEFSSDGSATLFDFWQVGMPILLLSAVCIACLAIWMMTGRAKRY